MSTTNKNKQEPTAIKNEPLLKQYQKILKIRTMKNNKLFITLTAAFIFLAVSAVAQKAPAKAGNDNTGQAKPGAGTTPEIAKPPTPSFVSPEPNAKKGSAITLPNTTKPGATGEQLQAKPIAAPVAFKPRPAGMNTVTPKVSVKPALPSTIAKPVEPAGAKATVPAAKADNPGAAPGPKLAPEK